MQITGDAVRQQLEECSRKGFHILSPEIRVLTAFDRIPLIDFLILDVDGTLTDGKITFNSEGEEFKSFHVHDGMGIKLWQQAGKEIAIITARRSKIVEHRAKELGIRHVYQGFADKQLAITDLIQKTGVTPERLAYMGDDLNDLAAMKFCSISLCPANAVDFVKIHCDFKQTIAGGEGAVREAIDFLLDKMDLLVGLMNRFNQTHTMEALESAFPKKNQRGDQ